MAVMSVFKKVVSRCLVTLVSICISLYIVINLLYRRWKVGSRFFTSEPCSTPPPVLSDPELGTHGYMHLKNQGVKLHYVEKGDRNKPLMLLVHGFFESWFSWRHQMKEFSSDYWVVAVSLRGYDDSDRPSKTSEYTLLKMVEDLREFILGLGKDKCTYVGHDGGAVVGWVLVSRYPHMFERFISCNGPHPYAYQKHLRKSFTQMKMAWYVFFYQMPWLPEFFYSVNNYEQLIATYIAGDADIFTDEILEVYKYYYTQKGALSVPMNFYRNIDFGSSAEISKMKVPTLIIWGTGSKFVDKEIARLSTHECEDVQLKYIDGAGHFVQQKEHVYFNKLLWEYFSITQ